MDKVKLVQWLETHAVETIKVKKRRVYRGPRCYICRKPCEPETWVCSPECQAKHEDALRKELG